MILSGDVVWENGVTRIRKEGKFHKFNARLEQVSYNGSDAQELGQEAWYVTERTVFTRGPEGIELVEIAPGVDLDRDILAQMDFHPRISDELKEMDRRSRQPPSAEATCISSRGNTPPPRSPSAWDTNWPVK